jgi:hypothetical protein
MHPVFRSNRKVVNSLIIKTVVLSLIFFIENIKLILAQTDPINLDCLTGTYTTHIDMYYDASLHLPISS